MPEVTPPHNTPAPVKRRTSLLIWMVRAIVFGIAVVGIALVCAWYFLSSQTGVDFAAAELVARSEGRLEVDGATGSLLQTVRVRRLAWRGPSSAAIATDVVLTWSPLALISRRVMVSSFTAQHVELDVVPSESATSPPVTLALPFEMALEHVGIGKFDYHVGANRGTIDNLGFSYSASAEEHRVSELTLAIPQGTITGAATIGATSPYAIAGTLELLGAGALKDAKASLS